MTIVIYMGDRKPITVRLWRRRPSEASLAIKARIEASRRRRSFAAFYYANHCGDVGYRDVR